MRKGILLGLALVLMVLGTAMESRADGAPPVLEKVWVSPQVNHGDMLKIYIMGSDPDGDIRFIQVGAGRKGGIVGSMLRLKKDDRKDLNGYVYWDTGQAAQRNTGGTVEITLQDWKGNESESMSVPVRILPMGAKSEATPAEFKDKALGPIMIDTADLAGY
jgi:hypothetical protein